VETCARCKAQFGCGQAEGGGSCWCADLPPIMPVKGESCLCPSCLRAEVAARVGDCLGCAHARVLKSKSGGAIFLCGRAESEPAYPRYPRLPTRSCPGVSR
jgi:hypothetical protein